MKKSIKKAFTLAEIMIVLTIIGVLTAILLPNALRSTPDENVAKFKKANNTLALVIGELASSDKYYFEGDLGRKPDGSLTAEGYFCKTIASILSAKSVDCTTSYGTAKSYADIRGTGGVSDIARIKTTASINVDAKCEAIQKNTIKADKQIVTTDGVVWFEESTKTPFGINDTGTTRLFGGLKDSNGFDAIYKIYCIDVDGYSGAEAPFGYAIRADGKIISGARADAWVQKSIQQKD